MGVNTLTKIMKGILTTVSTVCAAAWGAFFAYATEEGSEVTGRAADFMFGMDVLQKICLVIVIVVAVAVLGFYLIKMILKKMHVPPEDKSKEQTQDKE